MIGIISDIHGNYPALSAVLAELDELGITEIVCLGDIGGYCCQINECCEVLRSRNIPTLMGNHDWYLVSGEGCPRSNSANQCLDHQRHVIAASNLAWLSSLSSQARLHGIEMVHGGWTDPLDEYLTPSSTYFESVPGLIFASGHTHVPCIWTDGIKSYCNPGSVGQPRDGDPRASFATWDGQIFRLRRTKYDVAGIQREMADAGFTPYFYEHLSKGSRIGGRVDGLR